MRIVIVGLCALIAAFVTTSLFESYFTCKPEYVNAEGFGQIAQHSISTCDSQAPKHTLSLLINHNSDPPTGLGLLLTPTTESPKWLTMRWLSSSILRIKITDDYTELKDAGRLHHFDEIQVILFDPADA